MHFGHFLRRFFKNQKGNASCVGSYSCGFLGSGNVFISGKADRLLSPIECLNRFGLHGPDEMSLLYRDARPRSAAAAAAFLVYRDQVRLDFGFANMRLNVRNILGPI